MVLSDNTKIDFSFPVVTIGKIQEGERLDEETAEKAQTGLLGGP